MAVGYFIKEKNDRKDLSVNNFQRYYLFDDVSCVILFMFPFSHILFMIIKDLLLCFAIEAATVT